MDTEPKDEPSNSSSRNERVLAVSSKAHKAIGTRKTRVKSGCVTCRIRRIKCDEKRPNCEKCTSTGRKCDGYPTLPMSRKDLPVAVHNRKSLLLSSHKLLGMGGLDDGTEMLYYDFFRNRTTPGTNCFLGSEFWEKLVLQLSHTEPAIRHVVLAISALHQQWDMYRSTGYTMDSSAVAQYGKGVHAAQAMIQRTKPGVNARKDDIEKLLVACILFVCFEYLIGDYEKGAIHLSHALQVLDAEGIALSARGMHSRVDATIVELLNRFDFQAMTFSQTQFPLRRAAIRFKQHPPMPLPLRFETLTEIRSTLFEQVNWTLAVGEVVGLSRVGIQQDAEKTADETFVEASRELGRAEATMMHMWQLIEEFIERVSLPLDPAFRSSATYAYMRVYHHTANLMVMAGCTGVEEMWDVCMPEFQENLDYLDNLQAAQVALDSSLSLEIGICVPLFVIASKCRDPAMRRRAISILERSDRKEGIWETIATARVVERAVIVEENEARRIHAAATGKRPEDIAIKCAADIPEEARAQVIVSHVDMARRRVTMDFRIRSGTPGNPLYKTRLEKVEF